LLENSRKLLEIARKSLKTVHFGHKSAIFSLNCPDFRDFKGISVILSGRMRISVILRKFP
jgi:hypothetical protein